MKLYYKNILILFITLFYFSIHAQDTLSLENEGDTLKIENNKDTIWLRDGTVMIGKLLSDRGPHWKMRVEEDSVFMNWIIYRWDIEKKQLKPKPKKIRPNDIDAGRSLAISFEGGGLALVYSLNADVRLLKKTNGPGLSLGFGMLDKSVIFIPIAFNHLIGKRRHLGELGIAMTLTNSNMSYFNVPVNYTPGYTSVNDGTWRPYGFLILGYRYAEPNGVFCRIACTPFISKHEVIPFHIGVSVGFNFNKKNNK